MTARTLRRAALLAATSLTATLAAVPPADAAPTWRPSTYLTNPAVFNDQPDVAVDAYGNSTAVWRSDETTDTIRSAVRPAGGEWSAPVDVTPSTTNAADPLVTMAPNGTTTAVWRTDVGIQTVLKAATRTAGGAWEAALPVSTGSTNVNSSALWGDLVSGPDGTTTVVFQQSDGTSWRIRAATRSPGESWPAVPAFVSPGGVGANAEQARVAVDTAGRVTAVWLLATGGPLVVQSATLEAGVWSPPVTLSDVTKSAFEPALGVDGAGNVTVVWQQSGATGSVQARTRAPGGAWGAVSDLSAVGDVEDPDVAVGADGTTTAVWTQPVAGKTLVHSATRPLGGAWSGALTLSDPTRNALASRVAADPAGGAIATWGLASGPGVSQIQASYLPAGGTWSAPIGLSDPGFGAADARVVATSGGDAVAVWESDKGAGAVQAAGLDVAAPVISGVTAPATGVMGQALTFGASVSDVWSPLQSVVWTFGDGSTAQGTNPVHAYAGPGTYTVTLTATDAVGNAASVTRTTIVSAATTKPAITTFKLTKKKIATDEKTKLKVKLSVSATLKVVLKSKHRHLVKGKKKYLKVVITKKLPSGLSKVTIKGKRLKADTWKLVGTAKNAAGTSPKKKAKLVVVRD